MFVDWKKSLLMDHANIADAIRVLEDSPLRIAFVVDENNTLAGTITDGDIRRGLISHVGLTESVNTVMNKQPVVAASSQGRESILALMRARDIRQIPVVDTDGCIVRVELLDELQQSSQSHYGLENSVVLMAGGAGKRLHPLTTSTPKPMLRVGEKPILETIIEQLMEAGFRKFYVSIFYKGQVVRDYFGDGSKWGIDIEYLEESTPLGTAGALSLLPRSNDRHPIVVMNGDILTRVDFRQLLEFHEEQNGRLTMCVREYDFQVPYGVVELLEHRVLRIKEKPMHKFFVNAGIYVIDEDLINGLLRDQAIDMPDFINTRIDHGQDVNVFPIHEYWLDIGLVEQYKKAQADVSSLASD